MPPSSSAVLSTTSASLRELSDPFSKNPTSSLATSPTSAEWTRERVVFWVSLAYVVISILMVLMWSMYLCLDGRRASRKETRVIHMLAQRTVFRM